MEKDPDYVLDEIDDLEDPMSLDPMSIEEYMVLPDHVSAEMPGTPTTRQGAGEDDEVDDPPNTTQADVSTGNPAKATKEVVEMTREEATVKPATKHANGATTKSTKEAVASKDVKPCIFFARGICKHGEKCKFSHTATGSVEKDQDKSGLRVYKGARVRFGAGAEVNDIRTLSEQNFTSSEATISKAFSPDIPEEAILITFQKPRKTAKISYAKGKQADARWAARQLRGKKIRGWKINVLYSGENTLSVNGKAKKAASRAPPKGNKLEIVLGNLHPAATKKNITNILGTKYRFASIKWSAVEPSDEDIVEEIKHLYWPYDWERDGAQITRYMRLPDHPLFTGIMIEINDPGVRNRILYSKEALSGNLRFGALNKKLFPEGIYAIARHSVRFKVLPSILSAIQSDYELFVRSTNDGGLVYVKTRPPSGEEKFAKVHIHGAKKEHVDGAKGAFQALLNGTPAVDGEGEYIWDDFFYTKPGLESLQALYVNKEAYIFRDSRKRRLVLYGPEETKRTLNDRLVEKAKDLQNYTHVTKLSKEEFDAARAGAMGEIIESFGKEAISLQMTETEKMLTIYGTEDDFRVAKKIIKSHLGLYDEGDTDNQTCPICMVEAEDPVSLPCSHEYCRTCLIQQCSMENLQIPITCHGGGHKVCGEILSLDTLRQTLPRNDYDSLLYGSFALYVRTHPDDYAYCPTPDCPVLFKTSISNGQLADCQNCNLRICTTCMMIEHGAFSCEEAHRTQTEGVQMLEERKREMGRETKECPNPACGMVINRYRGCSKVRCAGCSTLFCWICGFVCEDNKKLFAHLCQAHRTHFGSDTDVIAVCIEQDFPHIPEGDTNE